jgi:hypothetical protein
MNGTSGFQARQSSTPDHHTYRFLHEQQPQFGTGSWHLHHTHDPIAPSTDIISSQENTRDTIFMLSSSPYARTGRGR